MSLGAEAHRARVTERYRSLTQGQHLHVNRRAGAQRHHRVTPACQWPILYPVDVDLCVKALPRVVIPQCLDPAWVTTIRAYVNQGSDSPQLQQRVGVRDALVALPTVHLTIARTYGHVEDDARLALLGVL